MKTGKKIGHISFDLSSTWGFLALAENAQIERRLKMALNPFQEGVQDGRLQAARENPIKDAQLFLLPKVVLGGRLSDGEESQIWPLQPARTMRPILSVAAPAAF